MTITPMYNTKNTTALKGRKIEYIVIHYDAGTNSKEGTAKGLCEWYLNPDNKNVSSDFTVDDVMIVQYNGDIPSRYTWGVGGSKYTSPSTSLGGRLYGVATNKNIINIEVKSSKRNKNTLKADDTDWYFTDAVLKNAADLVRYLMELYHIPADNVIMHHEVTGKLCPAMWCHNEGELAGWYKFKAMITPAASAPAVTAPTGAANTMHYVCQQLGAFKDISNAEAAVKRLKAQYPDKVFKIF